MKALTFQLPGGSARRENIFPISVETAPGASNQPALQKILVDIVLPEEAFESDNEPGVENRYIFDNSVKEEYESIIGYWKMVFSLAYHTEALKRLPRFWPLPQDPEETSLHDHHAGACERFTASLARTRFKPPHDDHSHAALMYATAFCNSPRSHVA